MFDSLSIYQTTTHHQSINYRCLNNIEPILKKDTGEEIITSELKNLKIKEYFNGISIRGSLAKYYLGNNVYTLSRNDTKLALEKIQDDLSLDLGNSKVYRIDIASNFVMKYPYKNYFNFMIDAPYTKRGTFNDSLYFFNKQRQLVFYDKPKEMRDKNVLIPGEFLNCQNNMLRYELRLKRRLKAQIGKEVTVDDLYNEKFFREIVLKWLTNYHSINKIQRIMINQKPYSTTKNYKDYLLLSLILEKGIDNVFNDIESNRDKFNSSVEATRCKNQIKALIKLNEHSNPNELIEELDKKINETAAKYIS